MTRLALFLLLAVLASWPAHARAQQVFNVANPPVVRMTMRSGTVTIRTWNKNAVQVESSARVRARQFGPQAVALALPPELMIPATSIQTLDGPLLLPPETFSLDAISDGPHDGVVIYGGDENANVTLTIPQSTALLWVMVGRGGINLQDYRSGSFVAILHNGEMQLQNTGGNAYAQVARGPIVIRDSAFNFIRSRTAAGNIVFENCNVRQVEAGSVNGSIAYDNGTFVPGVARFESQNGNVAIGVAGGSARIYAHSAGGKIFSGFGGGGSLSGSPTDAQAIIGDGVPLVTANSQRGGVYLYDGSLRSHGHLQGAWEPIGRILARPSAPRGLKQKLPHNRHI